MPGAGLKGTYHKVATANGPAQMLTYSFWGVLMAGMFQGVCSTCITPWMLTAWAALSALVVPVTIWGTKTTLRNILLADVFFSAWILVTFVLHEPHTVNPVYYSFGVQGMSSRTVTTHHSISDWFHLSALIWMTVHALYLADLTNRQILEKKRFENGL